METIVNSFLASAAPPTQVSEAVLDHDYTLLALRRYGEGAKEWWQQMLKGVKRLETTVCKPVRTFLATDLGNLKEAKRNLEAAQRNFDALMGRFASQAKTKEASSLREDAFQLHEARKQYLKASMDFCVLAPQVRASLDELLVKICSEQWRDMKSAKEGGSQFAKCNQEMDRVRGWSKEMENSERAFKRELHAARKQIEDSAEAAARPSRELDDYAISTVPYLGSGPPANTKTNALERSEKQGWLFQRTVSGKPARTIWVRRWFFVKNGIFGWLVQGARSGAVEESEKIGVLLCGVRPAFQEERRFCFEVKTKDTTIMLQAEMQKDLTDWISAFDVAKRKALEDPASTEQAAVLASTASDAAFAISPPIAPELAARTGEGHASQLSDEVASSSLAVPDQGVASRASFDVSSGRVPAPESSRDQYARIIQKLDLHRKGQTATPQLSSSAQASSGSGGIASLISASHAIMPVGPVQAPAPDPKVVANLAAAPTSTLAPSTLAYPPAPTNLSKTAVVISGERGLTVGRYDGGIPGGLLANLWGTSNWGYISRLERGELLAPNSAIPMPLAPAHKAPGPQIDGSAPDGGTLDAIKEAETPTDSPSGRKRSPSLPPAASPGHRKAASVTVLPERPKSPASTAADASANYPNYYPVQLKAQDAQFRLLFPYVSRSDKLVLVFRATFNPNDMQEFPGRVYVTTSEMYFYSHHLGLILITSVAMSTVSEVTAAPGRDCDFLFLHFKEGSRADGATRITIKTFLEPLKLLQRRLNYLVRKCNATTESPTVLEDTIKDLIKMETETGTNSPSVDSWEDVDIATPIDGTQIPRTADKDLKAGLRIDGTLYHDGRGSPSGKNATKFKLPAQPVIYSPQGMPSAPSVDREFNVSAKSLFHVLCGDKSAVFQMLYCGFGAERLVQQPWAQSSDSTQYRREIQYEMGAKAVTDHQIIDVYNDHLCYVVTERRVPWYLPDFRAFNLLSKIVITHVSKARCKLAIFTKVEWISPSRIVFGRRLIEARAQNDMHLIALNLADLLEDQASRVRSSSATSTSSTRRALAVFGHIGSVTVATSVSASDLPQPLPGSAYARAQRLRLKSTNIGSLALGASKSVAGEVVGAVLGSIAQGVQEILRVVSTHGLLVAVLGLSVLFNLLYTQSATWTWWQQRSAVSYMKSMGIAGDKLTMGRTVWLRDVESYIANANITLHSASQEATGGWTIVGLSDANAEAATPTDNRCINTFQSLLSNAESGRVPEPSSSRLPLPPGADSQSITTALPTRLQRTRTRLAAYRHDLLVALRVVNRVDREIVQAEYESWVAGEARRCRRVYELLEHVNKKRQGETDGPELKKLRAGHDQYCGDCYGAADAIGKEL